MLLDIHNLHMHSNCETSLYGISHIKTFVNLDTSFGVQLPKLMFGPFLVYCYVGDDHNNSKCYQYHCKADLKHHGDTS